MRLLFLVFFAIGTIGCAIGDKKIVCYYPNWTRWRQDISKFDESNADPTLCTHMIFSFVKINGAGLLDEQLDASAYNLPGFVALRQKSPSTKFMVAIGGWNPPLAATFRNIIATPNSRRAFADSVVNFLKKYQLDGLDIDWEYPEHGDKAKYSIWVKELSDRLHREGMVLSAATRLANPSESYDVAEITRYLDFVNLMAYDIYTGGSGQAGLHSALYGPGINIDDALKSWRAGGADLRKIILGIPFYGRGFTLQNPQNSQPGAPAAGPSNPGKFENEAGHKTYAEICADIKSGAWQRHFDNQHKTPYAVSGNQWIGYDDEESIKVKSQYIKNNGLGGAMVWSMNQDDLVGACGGRKYPLLNAINSELRGAGTPTDTNPNFGNTVPEYGQEPGNFEPVPPTGYNPYQPWNNNRVDNTDLQAGETNWEKQQRNEVPPAVNPSRPSADPCQNGQFTRDPNNCSVYYMCDGNGHSWRMECPPGLVFDTNYNICNYAYQVRC